VRKRYKSEEIIAKLRQVDVLTSQGQNAVNAIRSIGVSEMTYYHGRQELGGLKSDEMRRLKDLETENTPFCPAGSHLTPNKLIMQEVGRGNYLSIRGFKVNSTLDCSSSIAALDAPRGALDALRRQATHPCLCEMLELDARSRPVRAPLCSASDGLGFHRSESSKNPRIWAFTVAGCVSGAW
jgi:hypothetical protein